MPIAHALNRSALSPDRLVDAGESLIVIEHHLAVMAHAHWRGSTAPGRGGIRKLFAQ
jgi:excinuclease UvrABC ATPase subunit